MSTSQLSTSQHSILETLQSILDEKIDKELQNKHTTQLLAVHHGSVVPTPRECDQVYDRIYIGGEKTARDIDRLVSEGFTHVINCAEGKRFGQVDTNSDFYSNSPINYLGIPGHDSTKYNITPHFYTAAEFVKSSAAGKILIHCHQGISRSSAVTIACLMLCYNLSAAEALRNILERRLVMPNKGFLKQLAIFQDTLNSQ